MDSYTRSRIDIYAWPFVAIFKGVKWIWKLCFGKKAEEAEWEVD